MTNPIFSLPVIEARKFADEIGKAAVKSRDVKTNLEHSVMRQTQTIVTPSVNRQHDEALKKQKKSLDNINRSVITTRRNIAGLLGFEFLTDGFDRIKSFLSDLRGGFGSLIKGAGFLAVKLLPVVAAFTAIAGVVNLIKEAFRFNIGGVTEKWARGVGEFRLALSRLRIASVGLLQSMAPIFEQIGNLLLFVLRVVTSVINAITRLTQLFSSNRGLLQGLNGSFGGGVNNNNNFTIVTQRPIDRGGANGFVEAMNGYVTR